MTKLLLALRTNPPDDDDEEIKYEHHTHHHHHHHHGASDSTMGVMNYSSECRHSHPVFDAVHEHMVNTPVTWMGRMGSAEEMLGVIRMEFEELLAARSSGSKHAMKEELVDLAAACMFACKELY